MKQTKTPEQMAEEYRKAWGDEQLYKIRHEHKRFEWGDALIDGFLAGYHTAYNIAYELGFEEALKAQKTLTYIQAELKKTNENP